MHIPYGKKGRISSFTAEQYDYPDPSSGCSSFLLREADVPDWNAATLVVEDGNTTHLCFKAYRSDDPFSGKAPYVYVARCDITFAETDNRQPTTQCKHTSHQQRPAQWVSDSMEDSHSFNNSSESYPGWGSYYNN